MTTHQLILYIVLAVCAVPVLMISLPLILLVAIYAVLFVIMICAYAIMLPAVFIQMIIDKVRNAKTTKRHNH